MQSKLPSTVKPSLLGDPITAKAGIILQCLSNQLMPQPVMPSTTPKPLLTIGQPELKFPTTMDQLLQNVRNININLLMNLGQAITAMHSSLTLKESQKQRVPGAGSASLLGAPPLNPLMGREPGIGQNSSMMGQNNPDMAPKSLLDVSDQAPKGLLGQKPKSLLDLDFSSMGQAKGGMFQGSFRNGPVGNLSNQRGANSSFARNLQFTGQKNPNFNFTAMSSKTTSGVDHAGGRKKTSLLGMPARQPNHNEDMWLTEPPFQTYNQKNWETPNMNKQASWDSSNMNKAASWGGPNVNKQGSWEASNMTSNMNKMGCNENYSGSTTGSWDYNDSGYGVSFHCSFNVFNTNKLNILCI